MSLNVGVEGSFEGSVELVKPGVEMFVRSVDLGHGCDIGDTWGGLVKFDICCESDFADTVGASGMFLHAWCGCLEEGES